MPQLAAMVRARVAPHAGAWIETQQTYHLGAYQGRPSRRGVD